MGARNGRKTLSLEQRVHVEDEGVWQEMRFWRQWGARCRALDHWKDSALLGVKRRGRGREGSKHR